MAKKTTDLQIKIPGVSPGKKPPEPSKSLKDDRSAIEELGKYLLTAKPSLLSSESGEKDLIAKEDQINSWHTQATEGKIKGTARDSLEKATNFYGAVTDRIKKKPGGVRDEKHFSKIRNAGKFLISAADLLDNPDDQTK